MATKTKTAEVQCARCGLKRLVDDVRWTCAGCGGVHVESPIIFEMVDSLKLISAGDPVETSPAEIPLIAVLRRLNSMPSDGTRHLYEKLSILRWIDEANRHRYDAGDYFDQVKRVLVSCGVVLD